MEIPEQLSEQLQIKRKIIRIGKEREFNLSLFFPIYPFINFARDNCYAHHHE